MLFLPSSLRLNSQALPSHINTHFHHPDLYESASPATILNTNQKECIQLLGLAIYKGHHKPQMFRQVDRRWEPRHGIPHFVLLSSIQIFVRLTDHLNPSRLDVR
jgi:hypothetical protein